MREREWKGEQYIEIERSVREEGGDREGRLFFQFKFQC